MAQDCESSVKHIKIPVLSIVQVSTVASSSKRPEVAVAVKELAFPTIVYVYLAVVIISTQIVPSVVGVAALAGPAGMK